MAGGTLKSVLFQHYLALLTVWCAYLSLKQLKLSVPCVISLVFCCLQLGLNVMADLTNDEYRQRFLGTRVPEERLNRSSSTDRNSVVDLNLDGIPQTVDWRNQNAVTKVKNQESVRAGKTVLLGS